MAELKTKVNDASVDAFLASVSDDDQRTFAQTIAGMMAEASGAPAKMWGSSIVGYGSYTYHYASGRSGDWMRIGFSPRKSAMSVYIMPGFSRYDALLGRLGKYKTGKSCLYIKRERDVDMDVLRELIEASLEAMAEMYPEPKGSPKRSTTKAKKKSTAKKKSAKAQSKAKPSAKKNASTRPSAKAKAKARSKPSAKAKSRAKPSAKKSAKSR